VFGLRDGKYYLAEFWCVSDRQVVTAAFDHGRQTTAEQREVQISYPQTPTTRKSNIWTNGSDEVVHDATSIAGGVFTRSTNFRANNLATQSEVDGGASGSP
jgi:hypothetical protein